MAEEEKKIEFRVDIVNALTEKLEKMLFDGMQEHKMSIWETENVFLRLRFDLDEYKHTIMHMNPANSDGPPPDFKGSSSMYR